MSSYGKLSSEFYALDKPDPPPDAFDFYRSHALAAGGPIHEPMCGTGRYLLPLRAQGLDISGSDSSAEMLDACHAAARERGLSIQLQQSTLERLVCPAPPRLLFIPSGSFGLLIDDAAITAALGRIFHVLAAGGTFLVEVDKPMPVAPETSGVWGGRWVERADGAKLVLSWLTQYSGSANVSSSLHRYELVKDGQLLATEYEDFRVRTHTPADFHTLLTSAGFVHIEALKPYADVAADDTDDALVFKCSKPAKYAA